MLTSRQSSVSPVYRYTLVCMVMFCMVCWMTQPVWVQDTPQNDVQINAEQNELEPEAAGMTLFDLLAAGGWVMYVIIALSALALTMAIYFFITITERALVPPEHVRQIRNYLREGRYDDIVRLCRRSTGMFSKVVLAGVMRGDSDPSGVSAAMESVGRRESENIMRRIRFLSDIATVAPMLGLLGTVLGMIKAFNFIAFDISVVKPVALAGAVAQALVTTAAGLIVAIPSMGFFFFFRARLQSMVGQIEEVAVEVAEQLSTRTE